MQLVTCSLFAWLSIALFSLMPKRLALVDFLFMYCVILIMTTTAYSIFDINMDVVSISRSVAVSFATIITRVITIPLILMMSVNFLQSSKDMKPRWMLSVLIWMLITVFDWILDLLKVITYHRPWVWHMVETSVIYFGFITVAWGFTWFYTRLDARGEEQT